MNTFDARQHYVSDQGFRTTRLPVLAAGGMLAALAVAWVLQFLYFRGWYFVLIVPVFAGLALAGLLHLLVGWAHCRNCWLAAMIGIATGVAAYLGYFHLCLIEEGPPGAAARLDMLPEYIVFRMQNDVQEDVGRADLNNQPKKPSAGLNWYTFVFELLAIVCFGAAVTWNRARRAYCLELGEWMQREISHLPPYSSPAAIGAFDSEQKLEHFAKTAIAGGDPQTACRLILEYAPPTDGSALKYPVYLTIEDLPNPKPKLWPGRLRRTLVRQAVLSLPEVIALRPLFPVLTRLLGTQHAELRDTPVAALATPCALPVPESIATIKPVPERYRQQVRSSGYTLKVNLIGLTPLYFIGLGIGAIVLGGFLVSRGSYVLSVVPFMAGAAGVAWGVYVGLFCLCVYENRWIERRLRTAVALRGDSLIDPRDPESIYASLIPRESFTKVQLTMSSDLLLLRIDPKKREILLEGDCDRYRIPAEAITECKPQCFFHPIDQQRQNELWMIRLMIQTETGARELLLCADHTDFRPRKNDGRRKVAEDLCQRILALKTSPAAWGGAAVSAIPVSS